VHEGVCGSTEASSWAEAAGLAAASASAAAQAAIELVAIVRFI
jgi:hypothetical protein